MKHLVEPIRNRHDIVAIEKYLKENPRFVGGSTYRVSTSTGSESNGSGGGLNASINDKIRAAARR